MDRRRLVVIAVALILGVGGTTVLVRYVRASEQRALAGQELVEVFVVTEAIDEGTPAAEVANSVESKRIPLALRAQGAVTDVSSLGDLVVNADLSEGEQLVVARFEVETDRTVAGGDILIPEGLVEITFFANVERGVGGQVSPGETVAVIATFDGIEAIEETPVAADQTTETTIQSQIVTLEPQTHFLLRKALVVNVQTDVLPQIDLEDAAIEQERSRSLPTSEILVTVALAPSDAERLVFAREFGSLWLAREPEFVPEDPTPIVTYDGIFTNVLEGDTSSQPVAKPELEEAQPEVDFDQPSPDRLANVPEEPDGVEPEPETGSETDAEQGEAGE